MVHKVIGAMEKKTKDKGDGIQGTVWNVEVLVIESAERPNALKVINIEGFKIKY